MQPLGDLFRKDDAGRAGIIMKSSGTPSALPLM
jgi:hypothetical protein